MRHGGVGIHYDCGSLVISNLFQQRRWVLAVVKHAHRQSLLGNEELPEELLQVQQACQLEKPHQPTHKHTQTRRTHQQSVPVIVMKKRKRLQCCRLIKAENHLPSFIPHLSPVSCVCHYQLVTGLTVHFTPPPACISGPPDYWAAHDFFIPLLLR